MSTPIIVKDVGAEAAAAPAASPARPLIVRGIIGALALLGLSGIGAISMLAGLDGAHASPPLASQVWMASSNASAGPTASANPSAATSAGVEAAASAPQVPAALEPPGCTARTDDGRVILNLAKLEDLRKIPGIGPKRAEAILALRTKLKRFKRGADLLRVRGIGPKSLTRMQAHFVVDPPAGSPCSAPNPTAK